MNIFQLVHTFKQVVIKFDIDHIEMMLMKIRKYDVILTYGLILKRNYVAYKLRQLLFFNWNTLLSLFGTLYRIV